MWGPKGPTSPNPSFLYLHLLVCLIFPPSLFPSLCFFPKTLSSCIFKVFYGCSLVGVLLQLSVHGVQRFFHCASLWFYSFVCSALVCKSIESIFNMLLCLLRFSSHPFQKHLRSSCFKTHPLVQTQVAFINTFLRPRLFVFFWHRFSLSLLWCLVPCSSWSVLCLMSLRIVIFLLLCCLLRTPLYVS